MQAFDIALYALAIIAVLLLRAERPTAEAIATPAPAAPAPIVEEPQPEPQPEAPAQPASIAAPVAVAVVEVADAPTEFAAMNSIQLRKECQTRGIRWRNAHGTKHLSKKEMLAALA